jgi:hypothetical protein
MTALATVTAALSAPAGGLGHWVCFPLGLAAAAVPLGLVATLARVRDPIGGALAGGAAGALAVGALRLHCPWGGVEHGIVVHGLVVPVAALAGLLLARLGSDGRREEAAEGA